MELEYDLTEPDLLALAMHGLHTSSRGRRLLQSRRVATLVGFAMLALGTWLITQSVTMPVLFVSLGLLFAAFYPAFLEWRLRQRVAASFRDPRNAATFATRTLDATDDGLQEVSGLGELKLKWAIINELSETPTHAFLSVQGVPSLVIPRGRISRGDYRGFLTLCREKMQLAAEKPVSQ